MAEDIDVPFHRFDPDYLCGDYSVKDALALALASAVAYFPPDRAAYWFERWGFPRCEFIEVSRGRDIDTQGYLAQNDDQIIACFRGSERKYADWATNFQTVKDPAPLAGSVHEGFQDAFQATAYKVGYRVAQLCDRQQGVWITGHSLGGAMAVMLAATMLEAQSMASVPLEGLYTFGAPRVGNKKFARELNRRFQGRSYYRVINRDDLVPHLPPELFFEHAGNRVLYYVDDEREEDDLLRYGNRYALGRKSDEPWRCFKQSMWGWIGRSFSRGKLRIAGPHMLATREGYLRQILAEMDRQE